VTNSLLDVEDMEGVGLGVRQGVDQGGIGRILMSEECSDGIGGIGGVL